MGEGAPRQPCISCAEPVRAGARVCPHCRAPQKTGWSGARLLAVGAGVVTVLSLLFALERAYGVFSIYTTERRAAAERVAATRALAAAGDYEAAWEMLEQARRADPGAARVREAQRDTVGRWLFELLVPSFGRAPARSPGEMADAVYPALVVAAALSEGEQRADLEALVLIANLLRGQEYRTQRRDFGPAVERLATAAPGSLYTNLLLGWWKASGGEDPVAALESFRRARATGREADLVRRVELASLASPADSHELRAPQARLALLSWLDERMRAGEPAPEELSLDAWRGLYISARGREAAFEETSRLFPLERQIELSVWLEARYHRDRSRYATALAWMEFIRARLLELAGDTQAAVAVLEGIEPRPFPRAMDARLEATWERLTGTPLPDALVRNPWQVQVRHLGTREPGDPKFDEAMEELLDWERYWDSVGDSLRSGTLPTALDGAIATLERWTADPERTDAERTEGADLLWHLRRYRGSVAAATYDFEAGLRELEALVLAPETPAEELPDLLFRISVAYTQTWHKPSVDFIRTEKGWQLRGAYLLEGLDRLAAALAAGFDDWDRIEDELSQLRELDAYAAFSLRHGRVPPRDDDSEG